jgi:hypothetical protein
MPPEPPLTVQEPSSNAGEVERLRLVESDVEEGESSKDIDTVLDGLGVAWPLTPKQRRRLAPKVVEALAAGWSVQRLTAHLGANPEGVKSPAAVLSARLDDLPSVVHEPEKCAGRPEWCGRCDEPSRTIQRADSRWGRCPDCHPQSVQEHDPGRPKPPSTHRPGPSTPTDHETGRSTDSVSHSA